MAENQKKILAQQIKADLVKDLEKAKKEEKSENGFGGCSWSISLGEDCSECRGNEWRLTYFGSLKTDSGKKWKERRNGGGWIEVFREELEPNDWKEIEGLIRQIKGLEEQKENKETQKYQEEQAEINQKLSSNPKMFFYEGKQEWKDDSPKGYGHYRVFRGWENNQTFLLGVSENQVANLSRWESGKIFCLIEGVENVPFEQKEPRKVVKSSDRITITPVDNSPYTNELQLGKTRCEHELKHIQKKYPDDTESIANTKKRIGEIEKEIQEEKKWLTEHGNNLPASPENKDNIPKSPLKELNYKTLLQYFQKNDIKSIKLVGDKWIVEYNHNQKNNEYPVSSAPASEFQALKNYFSKTNKNEITLEELNGDTNPTNPSQNSPDNKLLVGCIFGGMGLLIIGVAITFIFRKKKVRK